jgi:hypothetical protein
MKKEELRIGNLVSHEKFGEVVVEKIFAGFIYGHDKSGNKLGMIPLDELEPIEITEEYLLDFGFNKVVEVFEDTCEVTYELEEKEVFFSYSEDWSIAIADSKKTFHQTSNYITPNKELTNKVHLWQNLYSSLVGNER